MQFCLNGRINGIVIMLHTNKLNLGHQCKIEMFLIVTAWDAEVGGEKKHNCSGKCSLYLKKEVII